jgi:acetyl esterase/lipase
MNRQMCAIWIAIVSATLLNGCSKPTKLDSKPAADAKSTPQPRQPDVDDTPASKKSPTAPIFNLAKVHSKHKTNLTRQDRDADLLEQPPTDQFQIVKYPSPAGELGAYLSQHKLPPGKHPAIIWITGGVCNSIGDVWTPQAADNDQTASQFRQAGIIMMFPSLRGGNGNPGVIESFYGEVDDVLAAADFLAKQPQVDPQRIYLGGHSSGGTLALLVAESTQRFRAVFAFGPVADVRGYGEEYTPFDEAESIEFMARGPIYWLRDIQSPTFVIEGTDGNLESLEMMQKHNDKEFQNKQIHFLKVADADHFNILQPVNELLTKKVLQDTGPTCQLKITEAELNQVMQRVLKPTK